MEKDMYVKELARKRDELILELATARGNEKDWTVELDALEKEISRGPEGQNLDEPTEGRKISKCWSPRSASQAVLAERCAPLAGEGSSKPSIIGKAEDPAVFLLRTTPRYWLKEIKKLELMRKTQDERKLQTNPYLDNMEREKLFTRLDNMVREKLPADELNGRAPVVLPLTSRLAQSPYGSPYLKRGYAVSRQSSFSSFCSLNSPRPRGPLSPLGLSRQSSSMSPVEPEVSRLPLTAQTSRSSLKSSLISFCMPMSSHRHSTAQTSRSSLIETSRSSLISAWSAPKSMHTSSYISVPPQRQHLLEGHVVPGKMWRQYSTFQELAKLRISIQVSEQLESSNVLLRQDSTLSEKISTQKAASDWSVAKQESKLRRADLESESTAMFAADIEPLKAAGDLLEVRRDASGIWYLPNGKCLHWSEHQTRIETEKAELTRRFQDEFRVCQHWILFSRRIIRSNTRQLIYKILAEEKLHPLFLVQKAVRKFLHKCRCRRYRAMLWAINNRAATKIQSFASGFRDRAYSKTVKKIKAFLRRNQNIFVVHQAFMRAKLDYTGTIEPPYTSTAFALVGDAAGANEHETRTLTFVEYCYALNDHFYRAASNANIARLASSAITRRPSFSPLRKASESFSMHSFHKTFSLEQQKKNSLSPTSTLSPRIPSSSIVSFVPFVPHQEPVMQMVGSVARLFNLYDDSKLGVLSDHQFWSALRELAFITGIEINQLKAKHILRYARHTGGVMLDTFSFVCEMSDETDLNKSSQAFRLPTFTSQSSFRRT